MSWCPASQAWPAASVSGEARGACDLGTAWLSWLQGWCRKRWGLNSTRCFSFSLGNLQRIQAPSQITAREQTQQGCCAIAVTLTLPPSFHPGKSHHKQGHQTVSGDQEGLLGCLHACAAELYHADVGNTAHHPKLGLD